MQSRILTVVCCLSLLMFHPAGAKKPGGKRPPQATPPAAAAPAATDSGSSASAPAAAPAVPGTAAAAEAPAGATPIAPAAASPSPAEGAASSRPPSSAADVAPAETAGAASVAPPVLPVLKPEDLAIATHHFEQGEKAFNEGRYEEALNEFTTSYEISKQPDLLYNLSKVAIKLSQKDMAIGYLQELVRLRPSEQAQIDKEIAELNAPPPPPKPEPPVALVVPVPTESRWLAKRRAGLALIGTGAIFLATGGALLSAMVAVPQDSGASATQHTSMLTTGAFLAATGAVALLGGIVITVKRKSDSRVALLPTGTGLILLGQF